MTQEQRNQWALESSNIFYTYSDYSDLNKKLGSWFQKIAQAFPDEVKELEEKAKREELIGKYIYDKNKINVPYNYHIKHISKDDDFMNDIKKKIKDATDLNIQFWRSYESIYHSNKTKPIALYIENEGIFSTGPDDIYRLMVDNLGDTTLIIFHLNPPHTDPKFTEKELTENIKSKLPSIHLIKTGQSEGFLTSPFYVVHGQQNYDKEEIDGWNLIRGLDNTDINRKALRDISNIILHKVKGEKLTLGDRTVIVN